MPWLTRAHRPFCSYLRKYMAKACSKVLTNWSGCVEYVCMNESGVSSWGIPSKLYIWTVFSFIPVTSLALMPRCSPRIITLVPGGPSAGEMPVTTGGGLIVIFIFLLRTQEIASLGSFSTPPSCSFVRMAGNSFPDLLPVGTSSMVL